MSLDQNKKIAELLFPDVTKTVEDYLKMYQPRKLKEGALVTRFAPSPTGYLHIGGLYQSLLNSKLAHQSGGVFLMRIEDTDTKREIAGVFEMLIDLLLEFGIKVDEAKIGDKEIGDYGPYIQSKRKEIYRTFAKHLVAKGLAYPCFCGDRDEDDEGNGGDEQTKKEQKELGVPYGYYGKWAKCRKLSFEQIQKNVAAKLPFTIRIKADGDLNKKITYYDLRVGKVILPRNYNDKIILKSDGQALYHLAHIVDDTLMRVTTVVRGEEYIPSVPLHLQTIEYLGLKIPQYIHTPLLMTIDAKTGNQRKISKRFDPWADVRWFLEKGYPIQAIHEYLLNLLNSAFEPWRMKNPEALLDEYIVNPANMSKSGALFDLAKLDNISKNIIAKLEGVQVFENVLHWAEKFNQSFTEVLKKDKEYAIRVFSMDKNPARPRKDITNWGEIPDFYNYMFDEVKKFEFDKKISNTDAASVLENYRKAFDLSVAPDVWFAGVKKVAGECGFASEMKEYKQNPEKFKGNVTDVATIIRVALTGLQKTPDLFEIMKVLGKTEIEKRMDKAIKFLKK